MNRCTKIIATVLGSLFTLGAEPASAHHMMEGEVPSTWLEGVLSGLGHPVIGLDHLAGIVAVGLLAVNRRHALLMPLAFIAATVLGAAAHVLGADLPASELAVGLSVLFLGALLLHGRALPLPAAAVLFALAGLFHGYAYGESIVGAEPAPLAAYFAGFLAIQYAIAAGSLIAMQRLSRRQKSPSLLLRYGPGAAITAVAVVFLGAVAGL